MTFTRVDDNLFENPKFSERSDRAKLLYIASLSYSNKHLTDGNIGASGVRLIRVWAKASNKHVKELVDANLWEPREGGFYIHDWHQYNPPAVQVKAQRRAARERMTRLRSGERSGEQPSERPPNVFNPTPTPTTTTYNQRHSDVGAEAAPSIFRLYEETVGPFDAHMASLLEEAEKEYSWEEIQYAFNEASENDVHTWRYIEAILKNPKRKGRSAGRPGETDNGGLEHEKIHRRHELAGKRCPVCYVPEDEPETETEEVKS